MALFLALGIGATQVQLGGGASLALAAAVSTSVLSWLLWRSLRRQLALDGRAIGRAIGRGAVLALGAGALTAVVVALMQGLVAPFDVEGTAQWIRLGARALVVAVSGGVGAGVWLVANRSFQATDTAD